MTNHELVTTLNDKALLDYLRDSRSLTHINTRHATDSKNLEKYLEGIGMPKTLKLKPTVETLYMIVSKHLAEVPYNNIHFHLK